jgi:hypothetical protein
MYSGIGDATSAATSRARMFSRDHGGNDAGPLTLAGAITVVPF